MAELNTLARPYAKAAFEYADQTGNLEQWSSALALLAAVGEQDAVAKLISSPGATPKAKADSLIAIGGDQLSEPVKNFLQVLSENRRLGLLSAISQQFDELKAEREKSVQVDVIAARELSEDQQNALANALQRRLERAISINVSIDPSLLGGAVIRAGDTVIDGSVRGRLAKLSEVINS